MKLSQIAVMVFVVCSVVGADVIVLPGKLVLDGLASAGVRWEQTRTGGLTTASTAFFRDACPIGVTVRPGHGIAMRLSFDAGMTQGAQDIYAEVGGGNWLSVRAGQFVVPLGFEALTDPRDLKSAGYSLVKNAWKPYDQYDVGVMLSLRTSVLEISCMGLNGNGRISPLVDENNKKDVAGRVVVTALRGSGLVLAARSYYGRYGQQERLFLNAALEGRYAAGAGSVTGELQYAVIDTTTIPSVYVEAAYLLGGFAEPVARFSGDLRSGGAYQAAADVGLNLRLLGESARLTLAFRWSRVESGRQLPASTGLTPLVRIQVSM